MKTMIVLTLAFSLGQQGGALRFDEQLVNLGELRSQLAHKHVFSFRNQGTESLTILTVEPSCGCLAPRLENLAYRPGEKGTLVIEVKPASQPEGPHSWFATVRYRSGAALHEARLQVKAVIRHEVRSPR
jgi:hypothetical protein